MKKVVITGKSVEEAIKQGLVQLNTSENRVKVNIIEQATKGLFGFIGAKSAKVELELLPDAIEETILFLHDVFRSMKIEVAIDQKEDKEGTILNLAGPEIGIIIGRRGQTLDSLQYLVNIVSNRFSKTHLRVILDAENFRDRRKKTLEELSLRLASKVIRSKKEVILEPMSPQERKVIHYHLQEHPVVKTFSKGEEPNRRVVIALR
jgi:spoIIIJ-associated protein